MDVLPKLITMGGPATLFVSVDVVLVVVVVMHVVTASFPMPTVLQTGPVVVVWAKAVPAPIAIIAAMTRATVPNNMMRLI